VTFAALPSEQILRTRVDLIDVDDAARLVADWAGEGRGAIVCALNVHMVMEAYDDASFAAVIGSADLVVADGRPVTEACRLLGHGDAPHVRGLDLMLRVCAEAERLDLAVGLYGGSPETLAEVRLRLAHRYPRMRVTHAVSPPFREPSLEEDAADVAAIDEAGVQVLFVALGCPKQERWMAAHRDRLGCVSLGVGAAFDMVAGRHRPAPRWMQRAGLEWLFRLSQEPDRLWYRYLRHNTRFLYYFALQWVGSKRRG
jgi:N-acetylglucosaminyldiphosphoundecaprenol N-acetyl-beta-D-mannosaminyltransferase